MASPRFFLFLCHFLWAKFQHQAVDLRLLLGKLAFEVGDALSTSVYYWHFILL